MSAPIPVTGPQAHLPVAALWPQNPSDRQRRTRAALVRAGIQDVASLTRCSPDGLLGIKDIGSWAVDDVRKQLGRLGLALRGEEVAQ